MGVAGSGGALPSLITVHPSFLLRVREAARESEYRRFVSDLSAGEREGLPAATQPEHGVPESPLRLPPGGRPHLDPTL